MVLRCRGCCCGSEEGSAVTLCNVVHCCSTGSPLWLWTSHQVIASGCAFVYFCSHLAECGHTKCVSWIFVLNFFFWKGFKCVKLPSFLMQFLSLFFSSLQTVFLLFFYLLNSCWLCFLRVLNHLICSVS